MGCVDADEALLSSLRRHAAALTDCAHEWLSGIRLGLRRCYVWVCQGPFFKHDGALAAGCAGTFACARESMRSMRVKFLRAYTNESFFHFF